MSVRELTTTRPIPRFVKWLPIIAAAAIILPIFLSRPQSVRFEDLRVHSVDGQWFSPHAPNGSYGFVAITEPTKEPTKKPPKDSDGDGVPDNSDSCPSVPGVPENGGCPPDQDHDGIPDSADACPAVSGAAQFNGCPPPTATPVLPSLPTSGACVLAPRTSLTVNIRQDPSKSGHIVGSLPYNATPNVLGRTVNDAGEIWFQIDTGWVAGSVTRQGGDCDALPDPLAAPVAGTPEPPLATAEQGDLTQPTPAPAGGGITGDVTADTTNGVVPGSRGVVQFRDPATGQVQIFLLQNGAATLLPPFGVTVSFPALQPAGQNLAFFTGDTSALADLRLINLTQGGQPALLISARPDLKIAPFPVAWAPDGSALLVSLIDPVTSTPSIFRLNIENGALNGQPQLLVANAFAPTFSQEGDRIAYVKGGLFNRSIEVMSLADNSVTTITGTAPFDNCTMPAFGLGPSDIFFVCQTSGQTLLARFNQGNITPVAAPVTSVVSLESTGSRYIVISDNATVFAAPLNALVFTPVLHSGGRSIEYLQWLQGEGIPAG